MKSPQVGEFVRWQKPGPVILRIERVGVYDFMREGWWVQAGRLSMLVRSEPEDGIEWCRCAPE